MPALVARYPSVSPWNIRDLPVGDYFTLKAAIQQAADEQDPTPVRR